MNIAVQESITIAAPPEKVWDYTQDWKRRPEWDGSVLSADVVSEDPRVVKVRWRGFESVVRYKLYERPRRTSLAIADSTSRIVTGGGGSWEYAAKEGGTELRQRNTLTIRGGVVGAALGWLVRRQLAKGTRTALAAAKTILERAESEGTPPSPKA